MRNATKVPELGVDEAATGVNSIRDLLPASDLLSIPDPRSSRPFGTK